MVDRIEEIRIHICESCDGSCHDDHGFACLDCGGVGYEEIQVEPITMADLDIIAGECDAAY